MPTNKLKNRTVERLTLAEQVYSALKKGILEGDLRPGERLKELEIAQSLGASRTPVREALSKLEQEGLVQPFASGGLTVVELSEDDVVEIFGLLKVVESYAIRLAAEKITEKQLERLEGLCERAEQIGPNSVERLIEVNARFHHLLLEMTGHRRLIELVSQLRTALTPYRVVTIMAPAFQESTQFQQLMVRDHHDIVEAFRARDVERLVKLICDHNDRASNATLAHVWGG